MLAVAITLLVLNITV
ncbi:MAG: hypothetical protein M3065_22315, partial [Actinomycetota bacterium]|nr:hypothetical protein [Actinomycetota bacterium]